MLCDVMRMPAPMPWPGALVWSSPGRDGGGGGALVWLVSCGVDAEWPIDGTSTSVPR